MRTPLGLRYFTIFPFDKFNIKIPQLSIEKKSIHNIMLQGVTSVGPRHPVLKQKQIFRLNNNFRNV